MREGTFTPTPGQEDAVSAFFNQFKQSALGGNSPKPQAKWHDVRTYADGVHLARGFRKRKPHYRVSAEKARRKAQGRARTIERQNRKH